MLWIFIVVLPGVVSSQTLPAGFPVWEETARRSQLLGTGYHNYSFASRPLVWEQAVSDSLFSLEANDSASDALLKGKKLEVKILPLLNTTIYNSNRPFGWGNYGLQNGRGLQSLISPGAFFKFHFLEIQLRPELSLNQNKAFNGFSDQFSDNSIFARFRYWNFGDNPERFQGDFNRFATWGQSYASFTFGKAELGFSTQNIWWGPGQFSSLIFSNNARGMKHFFLKTKSPANIGIGLLEAQMIFGRAEDSGLDPTQNEVLNAQYFRPFSGDWRYVNGISISYQPSFLKNLSLGFNRTFQQYNEDVAEGLLARIPVFEAFQKERLFQNGNSVIYDQEAQDQQVSVFFRFKSVKGKFELYGEFGKRDHNFNWREFILNPEHARAYLFGFQKLVQLPSPEKLIQIRGEIIHQQESVNRYIRYPELGVINTSWQTHYQVRGFSNFGESMGAGIGVGGNAQILEFSYLKRLSKVGLLLQRIENHQDFFYEVQGEIPSQVPWVDFSAGLLLNFQLKNLLISTKNQLINATNYQWTGNSSSTVDFKGGKDSFTYSSTVNLIYSFN
ncbi:capsule assembly Wzi family protein [Algoriphagus alkaliphilus]|uniref:capsule assembly Wzi family protein n=1 Tax=Algoriphagus alkaliphilus TaxID=279824 RepID=UPI0015871E49|nr:capsule assembly Wzi family protein [Algoriphagus alkaliphilus]